MHSFAFLLVATDAISYLVTDEAILLGESELKKLSRKRYMNQPTLQIEYKVKFTQVVDGDRTLYFGTRPRDLGYGAAIVVPSGA